MKLSKRDTLPLSRRAGLLKLPDQSVQEMWLWLRQQYAIRALPYVLRADEHPFLTDQVLEQYVPKIMKSKDKAEQLLSKITAAKLKTVQDENKFILGLEPMTPFPHIDEDTFRFSPGYVSVMLSDWGVDDEDPAGQNIWSLHFMEMNGKKPSVHPRSEKNLTLANALYMYIDALEAFLTNAKYSVAEDDTIVEDKVFSNTVKKDAAGGIKKDYAFFRIEQKDWEHYQKETKVDVVGVHILDKEIPPDKGEQGGHAGQYWPEQGRVDVVINENMTTPKHMSTYDYHIKDLKETLLHELRHMVQDVAGQSRGLEYGTFGLPPRKVRDPSVRPSGVPQAEPHGSQRIEHPFRDVEFHTRLGDEVTKFKDEIYRWVNKKYFPWALKKYVGIPFQSFKDEPHDDPEYIRAMYFIRPSQFFSALKQQQPKKWQEAVKQFVKAVKGD